MSEKHFYLGKRETDFNYVKDPELARFEFAGGKDTPYKIWTAGGLCNLNKFKDWGYTEQDFVVDGKERSLCAKDCLKGNLHVFDKHGIFSTNSGSACRQKYEYIMKYNNTSKHDDLKHIQMQKVRDALNRVIFEVLDEQEFKLDILETKADQLKLWIDNEYKSQFITNLYLKNAALLDNSGVPFYFTDKWHGGFIERTMDDPGNLKDDARILLMKYALGKISSDTTQLPINLATRLHKYVSDHKNRYILQLVLEKHHCPEHPSDPICKCAAKNIALHFGPKNAAKLINNSLMPCYVKDCRLDPEFDMSRCVPICDLGLDPSEMSHSTAQMYEEECPAAFGEMTANEIIGTPTPTTYTEYPSHVSVASNTELDVAAHDTAYDPAQQEVQEYIDDVDNELNYMAQIADEVDTDDLLISEAAQDVLLSDAEKEAKELINSIDPADEDSAVVEKVMGSNLEKEEEEFFGIVSDIVNKMRELLKFF